jgi:2-polyprenyl-6-hydroxyphenyl methylase/3-demethylubiquinone-9 3-methyltransferase
MNPQALEIASGRRFPFGKNWRSFLAVVDETRIASAESSLRNLVGDLEGKRFLDVGAGSGLSSLAAHRAGAVVHSFDYDPVAVATIRELKLRHGRASPVWTISEGSVLDPEILESMGSFEVVHAWGVLHHTGDLWRALGNVCLATRPGGRLVVAIYNDQGIRSKAWRWVKRMYCSGPIGRAATSAVYVPLAVLSLAVYDLARLRSPFCRYREYHERRGMSVVHDWIDWLGGYPFETARPERVVQFCEERGFRLERLLSTRSLGNNQFVFRRSRAARDFFVPSFETSTE